MQNRFSRFAILILSSAVPHFLSATPVHGEWAGTSGSNFQWGELTNWSSGIPGLNSGFVDTADFPVTAPNMGVIVDASYDLSVINFENTFYVGNSASTSLLQLGGASPSIGVSAELDVYLCPNFTFDASAQIYLGAGGSLFMGGSTGVSTTAGTVTINPGVQLQVISDMSTPGIWIIQGDATANPGSTLNFTEGTNFQIVCQANFILQGAITGDAILTVSDSGPAPSGQNAGTSLEIAGPITVKKFTFTTGFSSMTGCSPDSSSPTGIQFDLDAPAFLLQATGSGSRIDAAGAYLQVAYGSRRIGKTYEIVSAPQGFSGRFNADVSFLSDNVPQGNAGTVIYAKDAIHVHIAGQSRQSESLLQISASRPYTFLQRHMAGVRENHFTPEKVIFAESYTAENDPIAQFSAEQGWVAQQRITEQLAERSVAQPKKPWGVFAGPLGSVGTLTAKGAGIGSDYFSAGGFGGFDYAWASPDACCLWGLGAMGTYTYTHGTMDNNVGTYRMDQAFGTVFSTLVPAAIRELSLNVILGGGYEWYRQGRNVEVPDFSAVAQGSAGGPMLNTLVGIEYEFTHRRYSAMPASLRIASIATLQYAWATIGGYKEHGAGIFDHEMGRQSAQGLWSFLGFRANAPVAAKAHWTLRPEIFLGWQYQYLHGAPSTTFALIGDPLQPPALIPSQPPARSTLIGGADMRFTIYEDYFLQLDYDLMYNAQFLDNTFRLQFNATF